MQMASKKRLLYMYARKKRGEKRKKEGGSENDEREVVKNICMNFATLHILTIIYYP